MPSTPSNNKRKLNDSPAINSIKKQRTSIDARTKWEIIQKCYKVSTSQVAIEYGLPASTISTIKKSKKKLEELFAKNIISDETKSLKSAMYPDIEKALNLWFAEVKSQQNVVINGFVLQQRALFFANKLGHVDFKASYGWLENFKNRFFSAKFNFSYSAS
jgi:hypothetical protein